MGFFSVCLLVSLKVESVTRVLGIRTLVPTGSKDVVQFLSCLSKSDAFQVPWVPPLWVFDVASCSSSLSLRIAKQHSGSQLEN